VAIQDSVVFLAAAAGVSLGRRLALADTTSSLVGVATMAAALTGVDLKVARGEPDRRRWHFSFSALALNQTSADSSDAGCTSSKEARMSIRWLGHSSRSSFSRRAIWVAAASYTTPTLASAPAWG
jgi:tryptophan synthase beta subunit